ncbi:serine palmitoyltransferase 2 [Mycena capillaripes]|nr:serine palmitoyltransferase 2 [Mycena capillaripes]
MSLFKKKKAPSRSATPVTSYFAALSQAETHTLNGVPQSATPALSLSSSVTSSSEDTVLHEEDMEIENADGLALPVRAPNSSEVFNTVHTEFGHCSNGNYRYISQHISGTPVPAHVDQDPPYYILLSTYISYLILICLGHLRDFVGKRLKPAAYIHLMPSDGYAPLNSDFDSFYTRRLKTRMDECFSQPVTGVAGRTIQLLDRISPDYNHHQIFTGARTRALNISSYNYLGFAQARGGCADAVETAIREHGISTCGSRLEGGSSDLHVIAEALVAKFMGTEDALISSMGFATNSAYIPSLVGKGCLVISDELNHASIRFGVRLSGANVQMFRHNDMAALENLLREVISQGQPKSHRPWKKILIIVEGLYSMEGTLVNLPAIMELKKKYKVCQFGYFQSSITFFQFYLFVDEAHSVGALGPHGRGVADYFNIPPRSIDILMGTFTKSFGAAGGYIAGNKALIDRLRVRGHSGPYAEAMTPPHNGRLPTPLTSSNSSSSTLDVAPYHHPGPAHASSLPPWMTLPPSLSDGSEGLSRLRRLAFNSRYLHQGLIKLGFITYGHPASPIVPLLLFNPGKMNMFHWMMKDRQTPIIVVVVAYPATPLVTSRVRFCVSAAHTKEDIDTVLRACDEVGDILDLKHGLRRSERWAVDEVCVRALELVNL